MGTLSDRLDALREERFVGRSLEIEAFDGLLAADSPRRVLYIQGPGGIGKTTLLQACARRAKQAGISVLRIDARNVPAQPEQVRAALALSEGDDDTPAVVLIDTFELWRPLETWLRDELLPQLPSTLRIVIAGRRGPSADWRLDTGWSALMDVLELAPFSDDETADYLQVRAVDPARRADASAYARGNPLLLAMAADLMRHAGDAQLGHAVGGDLMHQMVERLTRDGCTADQLVALRLCAVLRYTHEPALTTILQAVDTRALWGWLQTQAFMIDSGRGLYPHDLVRRALLADLKARDPALHIELLRGAADYLRAVASRAAPQHRREALIDFFYIFNDEYFVDADVDEAQALYPDRTSTTELPALERMIAAHEGAASARWLHYWWQRQPESIVVLRDAQRVPQGLIVLLDGSRMSAQERDADPALHSFFAYLRRTAPLCAEDRTLFMRFWLARDAYQSPSPIMSHAFTLLAEAVLTTPGVAHTGCVLTGPPERWRTLAQSYNIPVLAGAEFSIDGHDYVQFGHDYRLETPLDWMRNSIDRIVGSQAPPVQAPAASAADFERWVHAALRDFHRTHALQRNPLLDSRMVRSRADPASGSGGRVKALRELIGETTERLQDVKKTERIAQVLQRTYLEPERTQQLAADSLNMGYSTFRRQLAQARQIVVAELWQIEEHMRG